MVQNAARICGTRNPVAGRRRAHSEFKCIARWKIGNIGNIVINQQLSRQQTGNTSATSATGAGSEQG
jgi:hypothetical protein